MVNYFKIVSHKYEILVLLSNKSFEIYLVDYDPIKTWTNEQI